MTFETFGQSDEGTLQDQKKTLTTTMTTTKTMTKKMTKTMTKTNIFRVKTNNLLRGKSSGLILHCRSYSTCILPGTRQLYAYRRALPIQPNAPT